MNSLCHAAPPQGDTTGKPELINDEVKWWDLGKCVKEYWKGAECASSKNIEFFVGIRNKIEHSLMPELDLDIFGECQAYLINFETLLTKEFGESYALTETLAMSLQFSRLREANQNLAARRLHESLRSYCFGFRENPGSAAPAQRLLGVFCRRYAQSFYCAV